MKPQPRVVSIKFRHYRIPVILDEGLPGYKLAKEGKPKNSWLLPYRGIDEWEPMACGGKTICELTVAVPDPENFVKMEKYLGVAICKMEDQFVYNIGRGESLDDAYTKVYEEHPDLAVFDCPNTWMTYEEYYPEKVPNLLTPEEYATLPEAPNA